MRLVLDPQPNRQDLQATRHQSEMQGVWEGDRSAADAQLRLTGGLWADSVISGVDPHPLTLTAGRCL